MMISGYACLFNKQDLVHDIIAPNALQNSPQDRLITMLWQHDPNRIIGQWEVMHVDETGLYVIGNVTDSEVIDMLKDKLIDALSIGFKTKNSRCVNAKPTQDTPRRLLDIELWEISIVYYPTFVEARIEQAVADD